MKTFSTCLLGVATLMTLVSCASQQPASQPAHIVEVETADELYGRIPAADCDKAKYKVCKEARKNDIADRYMLGHDGTFYRRINKATCAITQGVQDFKISQHPKDLAVVYYKKNNALHMINQDKERRVSGQCPSAEGNTKVLMKNIAKYTVTSSENTTIVNAALDKKGLFQAWDNKEVVYKDSGVEEYQMNECYKAKGKSFSSYVLFTRSYSDQITKVKAEKSGRYVKDASKETHQRYNSIGQFVEEANVCK